ncbi:MAG TPA: carbohydrate-binding domain-containing protein [Candidatus Udaeobacter sp.]|nr:carbohydrate-binding domain-containing protein [Candidatus Udaeobacter sp.]
MMKKKLSSLKLASALLSIFLLASCSGNAAPATNSSSTTESAELAVNNSAAVSTDASELVTYDEEDYDSDWESENPNYIELNGASASFKGSGAAMIDNQIRIALPGVYVVSGKLDDGQIMIDVENKGTVKLVLNGAEIHNSEDAAIYVKQADKTILTLQDGTQNIVSDGESYANTGEDDPSAAIFSKDALTINGTGSLTVKGNYNDGIAGKDALIIIGGNITIHSADDGLVGRDMLAVKEGTFTIEAAGDGIKSTNDTDTSKGLIVLEGGTFDIKAGSDGVQAETSLFISGGQYNIVTGGGSANGSIKAEDNRRGAFGGREDNAVEASEDTESQSAKGLKASSDITIGGGSFKIDSSDDAIHSNNSMTLAAEKLSITAGDDGIHADSSITITDGAVTIDKSYEGIESKLITISGGEIHVVSSDDGINIGGGNDGSSVNGRPGQNTLSSSGDSALYINGGYVAVDAAGDGLDSNGSIYMTEGTVIVNGPTANNNGALDYDGVFEISGGLLIAAGSAGMAEAPSEQSTQNSILMQYSAAQQAGSLISLQDSSGKTIATFAPKKEYQAVVISSPKLNKDSTYTLYSGGASTGSEADGLYTDGEYQEGAKIVSMPLSNVVTYLNESGVTSGNASNPGGGRMGRGGGGQG